MLIVLLLCAASVVAVVTLLWWAYRHRQLAAWDKELDAAFVAGERRPEVPRRRSL